MGQRGEPSARRTGEVLIRPAELVAAPAGSHSEPGPRLTINEPTGATGVHQDQSHHQAPRRRVPQHGRWSDTDAAVGPPQGLPWRRRRRSSTRWRWTRSAHCPTAPPSSESVTRTASPCRTRGPSTRPRSRDRARRSQETATCTCRLLHENVRVFADGKQLLAPKQDADLCAFHVHPVKRWVDADGTSWSRPMCPSPGR